MEIRLTSFNFPRMRGSGPRTAQSTIVFPRTVDNAVAGVTGYSAGFRGDDHHLGRLQVQLDTEVNANTVTVGATFGLRDWSGDWDDDYAGTIQVAVLAELIDPTLPPPRGDLQITGIESNQAIQFFRSAEHLDADNVMPDNSVPLAGGKTTGLRVYIDHNPDPTLPAISTLSGELEVHTGSNTLTLSPIADVQPRRDTEIDRGTVGHTLNFSIPGAWCRRSIEIRCRVFDAADPSSGSAPVRRTLRFVDVNPMRVFGVGVHYTGQGMDLPAPTAGTLLGTFDFARRTFPVPEVLLSGYATLDFSDDMFTTDTTGCGDGFESLNGELKDLRGDSDDLFYGLLPTGINFGTFIGCGGDGVGSGTVGDGVTAAHEAGHAYGRKHAPCNDSGRCNNPSNQDDDYPQYALYDSDSIGDFGFDPENNRVFDPAVAHDLMGYSPMPWISPYTYAALYSKSDPVGGGIAARVPATMLVARPTPPSRWQHEHRAEWKKSKTTLLFLECHVDAGGHVHFPVLFAFPAHPRLRHARPSNYRAAVREGDGSTRACVRLDHKCLHCGPDCWPRHLIGEIPIDFQRAAQLIIFDGDEELSAVDIPSCPDLSVHPVEYGKADSAMLRWEGNDPGELWFIVHWQDHVGTWRGVAPRQTDTKLAIPSRLRHRRDPLLLRVLASNGLSTTIAECSVEPLPYSRQPKETPDYSISIEMTNATMMRAWVLDSLGRSMPNPELAWYDSRGGEIARGPSLDLRNVHEGPQIVRAVAVNAGAGKAEREIQVIGQRRPAKRRFQRPMFAPKPERGQEPCE